MNDHEKKIVATYEECGSLDKTAKANALSEEQVAEVLQKAEVYEDRKRRFERYEGNKKVRDIETVTGEEVIHGTATDHVITEEQERQFLEEYINELSPESGHFTGKKKIPFNGMQFLDKAWRWVDFGHAAIHQQGNSHSVCEIVRSERDPGNPGGTAGEHIAVPDSEGRLK